MEVLEAAKHAGWFVEHFPSRHDIIGRTLPQSALNVCSHCNVSDQFYSSISSPRLLLVQGNLTGIPLINHTQTHNGEPRLLRMAHEVACTGHALRFLLIYDKNNHENFLLQHAISLAVT